MGSQTVCIWKVKARNQLEMRIQVFGAFMIIDF